MRSTGGLNLSFKLISGCITISENTVTMVDFSRYHLKVTYDARKQAPTNSNPQINFKYKINNYEFQRLGIRLPTRIQKSIKWRYTEVPLEESDQKLGARETWTLQIEDDGHTTLESPNMNNNVYENDFDQVPEFKGGSLETSFADFMTDGVSCYEIFDPSPLTASMS